jgi:acetyl-CoA carboxylase biotin carboxyl carrier protein
LSTCNHRRVGAASLRRCNIGFADPSIRPICLELRLAHDNLTYDDLLRIVELIKSSEQFSEFRLKVGEVEVELRRRGASPAAALPAAPAAAAPGEPPAVPATAAHAPRVATPPAPAPAAAASQAAQATWPEGSVVIRSPMVGTFYRAPEPGAAPFTDAGRTVGEDDIVCIIEVMKLMNSIPAGARGTVTHILVEDGGAVQAGQPLIVLAPA